MDELKTIETKLADAQAAVAELRQQLDAAIGQLGRFNPAAGELERAIDQQVRLQARRDVLQKRLELATAAAEELRGDLLIEREQNLHGQVKSAAAALDTARAEARATMMKYIRGGVLAPHEEARLTGVVEIFKTVAPLLEKREFLAARLQEAKRASADMKRSRAIADSQAAARMQADVFAGNI